VVARAGDVERVWTLKTGFGSDTRCRQEHVLRHWQNRISLKGRQIFSLKRHGSAAEWTYKAFRHHLDQINYYA
jgi:hypothetical protein